MCSVKAMDASLIIGSVVVLLAVMNPFLYVPRFLELTGGQSVAQRRRSAIVTVLWCLAFCALALLLAPGPLTGGSVLSALGIGIGHVQAAGGLVLLLISLAMLAGKDSVLLLGSEQEVRGDAVGDDHRGHHRTAPYPMAFPLIAGPATMAVIVGLSGMVISQQPGPDQAVGGLLAITVALAIALLVLGAVLVYCSGAAERRWDAARSVTMRLGGMLLAAFSAQLLLPVI